MSEEHAGSDRRRGDSAFLEALDDRLTRFEEAIDKRFTKLETKLEARAEWEKQIELRLAALESVNRIVTWVTATISILAIGGIMTFGWALLSNRIDIVDHNQSVLVVTATPHP